jgi:hypothetical protein
MKRIDLALYEERLAGEAAALTAKIEKAKRQQAEYGILRKAAQSLTASQSARLVQLLAPNDVLLTNELKADLAAIEALQAWVERELAALAA